MIRLINTSSLECEEFDGADVPPYAILSHRWGNRHDEISFKDFKKGLKLDSPGFEKIERLAKAADTCDLQWIWIDTCCIDKRSSAELSEAINSMFGWYQQADVCFTYMQDVEDAEHWRKSSWWQRGWTLQELIAPSKVIFCDRKWREIGSKDGMADDISALTGVPATVLRIRGMYKHFTVAQKLSWAAGRNTTKLEDRAYSLLGLFHINMPLLYGEGDKAFQRLQIEILQKYSDESLFAWTKKGSGPHLVLAQTPDAFSGCQDMAPLPTRESSDRDPDLRVERARYHRAVHPPRATSWGIEICANARKLVPLDDKPITVKGRLQGFLWAINLTTAWAGHIRELRITIILVRSGPAPYSYKRFDCYKGPPSLVLSRLSLHFDVCDLEEDKIFYLQFDADFDS